MTVPARTKIQKPESNGEHLQIKQPTSGFCLWGSRVLWNPLNSPYILATRPYFLYFWVACLTGIFNQSFIFVMDKTDSEKRRAVIYMCPPLLSNFWYFCSGWRGHLWPAKDRQKSKTVRKLRVNSTNKTTNTWLLSVKSIFYEPIKFQFCVDFWKWLVYNENQMNIQYGIF